MESLSITSASWERVKAVSHSLNLQSFLSTEFYCLKNGLTLHCEQKKTNLTGREQYVHSVNFSYTYQTKEDNNKKKGLQVADEMITEKDRMVKILNF